MKQHELTLLDHLDRLTSILETMLAHYGGHMPKSDRMARTQALDEARAAINALTPEPEASGTLYDYHFDLGNSSTGPIGYCARVVAHSKREAVRLLKAAIPGDFEYTVDLGTRNDDGTGINYITVYLNPEVITVKDIDDFEEADLDD